MLRLTLIAAALMLGGCGSQQTIRPESPPPVSVVHDGTPAYRADIMAIPDAVPRWEPVTIAGNKSPYSVLGHTYRVKSMPYGYRERGLGSWYGTKFHGQHTSNGEPYDVYAMTAAHKTLPIPSYVRVTNLQNGRSVTVRVNDRGPFHDGRIIDLSYAAAYKLGFAGHGTAPVELELLDPHAPQWVKSPPAGSAPGMARAEEPVMATREPVAGRQTFLQAGAFRSFASARQLQQTLAGIFGEAAFVQTSKANGVSWYRVRVGPLNDGTHVAEAQRRIRDANLGVAQIVTE